jgi:phosphomannomutase
MVTGSHNPAHHNGFKLSVGKHSLFPEEMAELARMAAEDDTDLRSSGVVTEVEVIEEYVARLAQDYRPGRDLTVVWDAGNGAAGEAMAKLTACLPGHHILLNAEIDGRFPAHHPDPSDPQNLEQLIATVKTEQADLGLAFDADGDRLGVVDNQGRILWGDHILLLLAEEVLVANPGALILADVKSSQALFDRIAAAGGKSEMCRTGNPFIKARMAETGALLAGEMSGHLFFADRYYGYDDALYAAVRLLSRIATWGDMSLAQ